MGKIWTVLVLFCLGYAVLTGRTGEVIDAALAVPYRTLDLVIKVGGIISFITASFRSPRQWNIDNLARLFASP